MFFTAFQEALIKGKEAKYRFRPACFHHRRDYGSQDRLCNKTEALALSFLDSSFMVITLRGLLLAIMDH